LTIEQFNFPGLDKGQFGLIPIILAGSELVNILPAFEIQDRVNFQHKAHPNM